MILTDIVVSTGYIGEENARFKDKFGAGQTRAT
jgi:hypothetical protein